MIMCPLQMNIGFVRKQFAKMLFQPREIDPDIEIEYSENLIVFPP